MVNINKFINSSFIVLERGLWLFHLPSFFSSLKLFLSVSLVCIVCRLSDVGERRVSYNSLHHTHTPQFSIFFCCLFLLYFDLSQNLLPWLPQQESYRTLPNKTFRVILFPFLFPSVCLFYLKNVKLFTHLSQFLRFFY